MNQLTGKEWEVEGLQIICCKNGVIILWEKQCIWCFWKISSSTSSRTASTQRLRRL